VPYEVRMDSALTGYFVGSIALCVSRFTTGLIVSLLIDSRLPRGASRGTTPFVTTRTN
jgi:hypothetical protein